MSILGRTRGYVPYGIQCLPYSVTHTHAGYLLGKLGLDILRVVGRSALYPSNVAFSIPQAPTKAGEHEYLTEAVPEGGQAARARASLASMDAVSIEQFFWVRGMGPTQRNGRVEIAVLAEMRRGAAGGIDGSIAD